MLSAIRARRLSHHIARRSAALARLLDGSAREIGDFSRLDAAFREAARSQVADQEAVDRAARRFIACLVHLSPRHEPHEFGKQRLATAVQRIAACELASLWQSAHAPSAGLRTPRS